MSRNRTDREIDKKTADAALRAVTTPLRRITKALGILLALAFVVFLALFMDSYSSLRVAIRQERMDYVDEISRQIIVSQQFMEDEYSNTARNYAAVFTGIHARSLSEFRALVDEGSEYDILLVSRKGEIVDLHGNSVFLSTREVMGALYGTENEVEQVFASLNYEEDYWLFIVRIDPLVLDGEAYETLVLAVPADRYRENLAISLFDNRGASYIIRKDGSVMIRPLEAQSAIVGYNLFSGLRRIGAPEEDVDALIKGLEQGGSESRLFVIEGEEWLIGYSSLNTRNAVVVAVPLAITAAMTYDGMVNSILMTGALIITAALIGLLFIFYFFSINRQRQRELMAVEAKSDFLSKMSHDMRTPLNTIVGLQTLALDCDELPIAKDYLRQSATATDYLLGIINDVLDMNRIESGKMAIVSAPLDMNLLIEEVAGIVSGLASSKDVVMQVRPERPFETYLMGDAVHIKQILVNLLSNSIKFTRPGGRVTLAVSYVVQEDDKDAITFIVSDTGVGMSQSFLARAFLPFEQELSSYTQQYAGSGLGLAIVSSLVSLMNGTIDAQSREGFGTTFTLCLTLPRGGKLAPVRKSVPQGMPAFPGKRVLLVEDNEINRTIAATLLKKRFELESDVAENGMRAIEVFRESEPGTYSLILMDVKMPVMDGLEATRRIRALPHPDARTIPIIALSANAFEEDVSLSIRAGMNAHLSKPLDLQAMAAALRKYIKA